MRVKELQSGQHLVFQAKERTCVRSPFQIIIGYVSKPQLPKENRRAMIFGSVRTTGN